MTAPRRHQADRNCRRTGSLRVLRLAAMLLSAPMAAFNTVLIPQTVSRLVGHQPRHGFGDARHRRCHHDVPAERMHRRRFRPFLLPVRAPYAMDRQRQRIGGYLSMAILSACDFHPVGRRSSGWPRRPRYAMAAIPFAAAFGERVPDKFRDRADSWHGKGLALGQLVGVAVAVALTRACRRRRLGWHYAFRDAGIRGLCLVVAGRRYAVGTAVRRVPAATCRVRDVEERRLSSRNTVRRQDAPKFFMWHSRPACSPLRPQPESPIYQWYLAPDGRRQYSDEAGLFGIVRCRMRWYVGHGHLPRLSARC